jgi:hypothetical protein
LEAGDPGLAPSEAAEAGGRLENEIMLRGVAHRTALELIASDCGAAAEIQSDSSNRIRRE